MCAGVCMDVAACMYVCAVMVIPPVWQPHEQARLTSALAQQHTMAHARGLHICHCPPPRLPSSYSGSHLKG